MSLDLRCALRWVGLTADGVGGVTRTTPVLWKWLAFAALMVWLVVHSLRVPAELAA